MKPKLRADLVCFLLSTALLFTSIFGLFGSLFKESAVYSAAKKTMAAKQETDTIPAFFFSALQNGETTLSWQNDKTGDIGSAVLLSDAEKNAASLSFSAQNEKNSLSASAALDESLLSLSVGDSRFFVARKNCAEDYRNSALSALLTLISPEAEKASEELFTALEPAADGKKSVLKKEAAKFYAKLSPKVKKSTEEVPTAAPFEASCTQLSFDGEDLGGALKYFWSKQTKNEALVDELCLLSARAASFFGKDGAQEAAGIRAFLTDENSALPDFAAALTKEDAAFEIKFYLKGGFLVAVKLDFTLAKPQEQTVSAFLFFGENPKRDSLTELQFSMTKTDPIGEKSVVTLHFRDEVTEDSKSAFVQQTVFSLSAPASLLFAKKEGETGEKNFSSLLVWGREKGDLSLKWSLDGAETALRGAVGEWKKGKSLSFSIDSAVKNKAPLFGGTKFQLKVKKKAAEPAKPSAEGISLLKVDGAALAETLLKRAGAIPDLMLPENFQGETPS